MDENEEHEFPTFTIKTVDSRARARKHTKWSILVLALDGAVAVLDALVCAASNALKAAEQHRSHIEEELAFYDIVSTEEYEESVECADCGLDLDDCACEDEEDEDG